MVSTRAVADSRSLSCSMPLTSAPEQKVPPAPVMTMARTAGSAWESRIRSASTPRIGTVIEFLLSGRLMVTVRTPRSSEWWMASDDMSLLKRGRGSAKYVQDRIHVRTQEIVPCLGQVLAPQLGCPCDASALD